MDDLIVERKTGNRVRYLLLKARPDMTVLFNRIEWNGAVKSHRCSFGVALFAVRFRKGTDKDYRSWSITRISDGVVVAESKGA